MPVTSILKQGSLLTGEAYFEVTKQSDGTPFVVKTDQYSVLVKGTKFNVSSYPEDISAKTTLLEGSIDILYKGRHIPVAPGELLSLDKQNGSFSRQRVQASQYKSWTEGRVEYDKITLNELAVRYPVNMMFRFIWETIWKKIWLSAYHFAMKRRSEMSFTLYPRLFRSVMNGGTGIFILENNSAIVNILLNLIL